jgi:hypothetical protein
MHLCCGCTENKQHDQFLYHTHPAYQGHNQWHDWAAFDSGQVAAKRRLTIMCIPGQIVFFLEIIEEMVYHHPKVDLLSLSC